MDENQITITEWAESTFGPISDLRRLLARANEEHAELLREITGAARGPEIIKECADIVIVLFRYATMRCHDLRGFSPLPEPMSPYRAAVEAMACLQRLLVYVETGAWACQEETECLNRLVSCLEKVCRAHGTALWPEIRRKMAVNRGREWRLDGTGHGYHVRSAPAEV